MKYTTDVGLVFGGHCSRLLSQTQCARDYLVVKYALDVGHVFVDTVLGSRPRPNAQEASKYHR